MWPGIMFSRSAESILFSDCFKNQSAAFYILNTRGL